MISSTAASGLRRVNGEWHRRALFVFMVIVWSHWAEHLLQAFQLYALGWAPPRVGGGLGLLFPSLATSEALHYGYNLVLICGLALLLPGFKGESRSWWWGEVAEGDVPGPGLLVIGREDDGALVGVKGRQRAHRRTGRRDPLRPAGPRPAHEDPDLLEEQLTKFQGAGNDVCVDIQFSVHKP